MTGPYRQPQPPDVRPTRIPGHWRVKLKRHARLLAAWFKDEFVGARPRRVRCGQCGKRTLLQPHHILTYSARGNALAPIWCPPCCRRYAGTVKQHEPVKRLDPYRPPPTPRPSSGARVSK